ncbi:hypothetical protein [Shewanella sp. SG44-2]|jgi:hypothetical protein|nr:hypothetical protein [Shewanella sp. SG44-2]
MNKKVTQKLGWVWLYKINSVGFALLIAGVDFDDENNPFVL